MSKLKINLRQLNNLFKKKSQEDSDIVINTKDLERKSQNIYVLIVLSALVSFCSLMGFSDGFKIGSSLILVCAISVVASVFAQLVLNDIRRFKWAIPIYLGGILLFVLIANKWVVNGFTIMSNRIIGYVNEHKAEAHLKFVVASKTPKLDLALATVVVVLLYALLVSVLIKYRRTLIVVFLMLALSMSNMYFNGTDQLVWVSMCLVLTIAVVYISNIRMAQTAKNLRFGIIIGLIVAVVSVCFVTLVNYNGIRSVDDLKDEIIYRAGNVIYGKSDYPEGQFKRFNEPPAESKETRLTVKMSTPMGMHLKGYVGCQYTEKGWTGNKENIYGGQNKGMIEWFLEQDYYPLTQLGYYLGYSRNAGDGMDFNKVKNSTVHILNKSASTKYEYVSENLVDMSGLIDPKQDVNFVEQDLFGEKDYWYDVLYYVDEDYLDFPTQNWFEKKGADISSQANFCTAENYYHGFASSNYLSVPKKEKEILSANVPACSNNVKAAVRTVRRYLTNHIKYSENCAEYNPDKNYLNQILFEDQRGYSVHFATVATLMLRYYGVPARYVEGYLCLNEDDEEKVKLTSKEAHAWVEVYIKGLGFVPVEVTPGFYQDDEDGGNAHHKPKPQINKGGGGGTTGTVGDEPGEFVQITWQMILVGILILLFIVFVIVIIVLFIRRIIIVRKRRGLLASDDEYVVVATASRYMDDVCRFDGVMLKHELPPHIRTILEKVKFGNYPLEPGDKDQVYKAMEKLTEAKWKRQVWYKKIVMMLLKALR